MSYYSVSKMTFNIATANLYVLPGIDSRICYSIMNAHTSIKVLMKEYLQTYLDQAFTFISAVRHGKAINNGF